MPERLLSIEEVSERTTVPVGTLRYWRHLSTAEKPVGPRSANLGGRRVVYKETEVDAWIEAQFSQRDGGSAA